MTRRERRIAEVAELEIHTFQWEPELPSRIVDAIERADAETARYASQAQTLLDGWIAGVSSWLESEHGEATAEGFRRRAQLIGGKS